MGPFWLPATPGLAKARRAALEARWTALVLALVVSSGASSEAFKVEYHAEITQTVLVDVAARLVAELKRIGSPIALQGFTPAARQEVIDANVARDQGDCGSPNDLKVPAVPCAARGGMSFGVSAEWLAALRFLDSEPASEHFDNETIQVASDAVFDARGVIRRHLVAGDFIAARKVLGGTLHALQDFYAHSNFIELGLAANDGWESRLGKERNAFRSGAGLPRLSGPGEATCAAGSINATAFLTTGYFFTPAEENLSTVDGLLVAAVASSYDIDAITKIGKCRHGLQAPSPVNAAFGAVRDEATCLDVQPGINKDAPCRPGFGEARLAAIRHSGYFIVDLIRDLRGALGEAHPKYAAAIAGLMGHQPLTSLGIVEVLRLPSAPPGQTMWDGVLEVGLNIWAVHPDVVVCVGPEGGRGACTAECSDFEWQNTAKRCRMPLGGAGLAVPSTARIRVQAWDIDPAGRQLMADGFIDASNPCLRTAGVPCQIDHERGPLILSFDVPGALSAPTASEPRSPDLPAPGRTPGAGRVPPSTATVETSLGLRGGDTCTGTDRYMPAGSAFAAGRAGRLLGTDRAVRVYQVASLAMAIDNPATKTAVFNALRAAAGDEAYFAVMTGVVADEEQASRIFTGYRSIAGAVAGRVTSSGLDSWLPRPRPATADVDRWIQKRLSTPALVSDAVAMMLDLSQSVSAECALNRLAKDGFVDTINGR